MKAGAQSVALSLMIYSEGLSVKVILLSSMVKSGKFEKSSHLISSFDRIELINLS
jgi:hypothetical protein